MSLPLLCHGILCSSYSQGCYTQGGEWKDSEVAKKLIKKTLLNYAIESHRSNILHVDIVKARHGSGRYRRYRHFTQN